MEVLSARRFAADARVRREPQNRHINHPKSPADRSSAIPATCASSFNAGSTPTSMSRTYPRYFGQGAIATISANSRRGTEAGASACDVTCMHSSTWNWGFAFEWRGLAVQTVTAQPNKNSSSHDLRRAVSDSIYRDGRFTRISPSLVALWSGCVKCRWRPLGR